MCILSVFLTYVHYDTRFRECTVGHNNNLLGDDIMLLVRSEPPLIWPASYVAAAKYIYIYIYIYIPRNMCIYIFFKNYMLPHDC